MSRQTTLFEDDTKNADEVRRLEGRRHSKPSAVEPPAETKHAHCMIILSLLRDCHPESVSSLLLREKVPLSASQRISSLRDDGYDIVCKRQAGTACGLYTLNNPEHQGEKYF